VIRAAAALRRVTPGLVTASIIALVATFVSEQYGGPLFLHALLLGIAFNFLSEDRHTRPGIELMSRTVLRLGVGLLGAQVTLAHLQGLGILSIILVVLTVAGTILFGVWLAKRLDRPEEEGVLSGGAVAICGASAALAIAAVLATDDKDRRFTLMAVVGVTALSTLAMVVYPAIATILDLDPISAGVFLGGTIHDVAQVVGAGYMHSPEAGLNATFVKLLRIALLVPVVFAVSFVYGRGKSAGGEGIRLLPWFLVLFVALFVATARDGSQQRPLGFLPTFPDGA
jgi:uncharacterized integral membrane protein (TIGR00698 family)